jgi:hypothetical protein
MNSSDVLELLDNPPAKLLKRYADGLGFGRTRQGIQREITPLDACRALCAHQLRALGLPISAAIKVAGSIPLSDWSETITSNGQRVLACRRDAKGWAAVVLKPDQFSDLWRIAPEGLIALHLGPLVRAVLAVAADRVPA